MKWTDLGNGRRQWIGHCTCGVKLVDGNLERPHHPSCECSVIPWTAEAQDHSPPATAKQLAYLDHLTARAGEPPLSHEELTIKSAAVEIDRLVKLLGIPARPRARGSKRARSRNN